MATGRSRRCTTSVLVSYGEDASQIRTGNGPQVKATLRNLAIGITELSGARNIAAACRPRARDATRTLTEDGLLASGPCDLAVGGG